MYFLVLGLLAESFFYKYVTIKWKQSQKSENFVIQRDKMPTVSINQTIDMERCNKLMSARFTKHFAIALLKIKLKICCLLVTNTDRIQSLIQMGHKNSRTKNFQINSLNNNYFSCGYDCGSTKLLRFFRFLIELFRTVQNT